MRRLGDVRARLVLSILLLGGPVWAATAPFAALTISPHGPQTYDITTGVTTLPQGGTVVDQDTGVALQASSLRYQQGKAIDARGAEVNGSFGRMQADRVHIDIAAGTLVASQNVSLVRGSLRLTASEVRYDAKRQVVDFTGPVRGTSTDFSFKADRVLLDATSGDVLLVGHYSYANGALELRSPAKGGRLELVLHQANGKAVYDASSEISPELLARFSTELP